LDVHGKYLEAVYDGDFEIVRAFLKKGLVHANEFGTLHTVIKLGYPSVVQELITAGADVNVSFNYEGKVITALQAACVYGPSMEVIPELLKAGADIEKKNRNSGLALLFLLELEKINSECKLHILRLLLEAKCNVNLCIGDKSALFLTCQNDILFDIFTLIVSLGADITKRNSEGMTALHFCIREGSLLAKIECLLKSGLHVNVKNAYGETPLHIAAASNTGMIPILLRNNASIFARTNGNKTALMEVICNEHLTCEDLIVSVRMILAKLKPSDASFLDLQNSGGWTALHFAAKRGCLEVIQELLKWKPDVTRRTDKDGRTALHIFTKYAWKQLDILRCLVEHENGYRTHAINLQDHEGCTALHLALLNDFNDALLQYLSNFVDVRITDKNGETPLYIAVDHHKSKQIIDALLNSRHGAESASIPNCQGMTALHVAVSRYSGEEIVRVLSGMIDVNTQDRDGKTALHVAVQQSRLASLNILLYEQKADPSIQDCEGNTPLSLACGMFTEKDQLSFIFQLYQYGVAYGENMVRFTEKSIA